MNNNGKKLMIVAGGEWQIPLIKKAKELGFYVINSNLYEDSPGFRYSDACEVSDVRDKEKNLEFALKHHIDGITTDQSDISVPTVAYVADKLGLPGIGNEKAKLFTNKYEMRNFCKEHGFDYPDYSLCSNVEELKEFLKKNTKIIIKPLDSQSSRGVFIIDDSISLKEMEDLLEKSKFYSSDRTHVLAERFIVGTEFTVDGIVTSNGHRSLCISEKRHFKSNDAVASELFFSHKNKKYDYDELRRINDALVDATGLYFGLTHAEYKYENGTFYLIEIAARGGGTKIASDIVPIMTGIDNYRYLLETAIGNQEARNMNITYDFDEKYCVLKFLEIEPNARPVKAIRGTKEILDNSNVVDLRLAFGVGDYIKDATDDSTRLGHFIAYGNTEEELRSIMQWVKDTLIVEFE